MCTHCQVYCRKLDHAELTTVCWCACLCVCVCGGGDAEVQKQLKQTRLLRAGLVGNPHSAVDKQAFVFHGREVTH